MVFGRSPALPRFHAGLVYLDFLPQLLEARGAKTYLEVGVHFGHMLSRIRCATAIGVDPHYVIDCNVMAGKDRLFLLQMTSDRFFAETDIRALAGAPLDLCFLDGLHLFEVLLRDVMNAEAASHPGGLLVLHDCLPLTVEMAGREANAPRTDPEPYCRMWTGDVWKIVPILARFRPDLRITLVDSAPTGLVCIGGLDPHSTVLRDRYQEIVAEFAALPNDKTSIARVYADRRIVSAAAVLQAGGATL